MNGDKPEQSPVPPAASTEPDAASDLQPDKEPDSPWSYNSAASSAYQQPQARTANPYSTPVFEVSWTASEFIAHSKSPRWFVMLGVATVVVDVLLYLWTRDIFTVVIITVMAGLFGFMAGRKPRVIEYKINGNGLFIGAKFFPYASFRSFAIIDDGPFSTLMFMPAGRFMPPVSVYYEPKDEERIMNVLGNYLPMEHGEHDLVDRLARRIRF